MSHSALAHPLTSTGVVARIAAARRASPSPSPLQPASSRSTSSTTTSSSRTPARRPPTTSSAASSRSRCSPEPPRLYGRVRGRRARDDRAPRSASSASSRARRPIHYTRAVGPSGDDYTGLLSIPAGLLLLGLGAVTLWSSRKTRRPPLVALRAPALCSPAPRRRRVRDPDAGRRRLRRHARRPRARPGRRPRCPVRGRRVHDERRPAAEGLVHPRRATAPP